MIRIIKSILDISVSLLVILLFIVMFKGCRSEREQQDIPPPESQSLAGSSSSSSTSSSLIPGVGFIPPTNSTVLWVWPGGAPAGSTRLNPSAGDPFGSGVLSIETFRARYGANTPSGRLERADGTIASFQTDAETILGACSVAVEKLAKQQVVPEFTGRSNTHTLFPTLVELHDIGALGKCSSYMTQAGVGSGAPGASTAVPGIPVIDSAVSPSPGLVKVIWRAKRGHSAYEVRVGPLLVPVPADPTPSAGSETRTATVELPAGIGGDIAVEVRAYKGGAAGKWSKMRLVKVETRVEDGNDIDIDPTTIPTPTPVTPIDPNPSRDVCYLVRVREGNPSISLVRCP